MKIPTHLRVARTAIKEYGLSRRAAAAFCFGTMVPDILPFYHPHYYKTSAGYVFYKLGRLIHKSSVASFFMRGVMAHYVTDFCCSAHANGLGNVKEHIAYERKLEKYTKENFSQLRQTIANGEKFYDLHEAVNAYINGKKYDCATDFCLAVKACAALLYSYTPSAEITKRTAIGFNLVATPIDAAASALSDALNETLNDVVKKNQSSV